MSMEKNDKVIITITLERNLNGTASRSVKVDGQGFHYFEMIGLLQICSYEMAQKSLEVAKELPDDKQVKMVYGDTNETPDKVTT